MPSSTLRALLAEFIDYAGLFPPAALPMAEAVAQYASYRHSADAWALGRLVVPAGRLDELTRALNDLGIVDVTPWRVSAIVGDDIASDAAIISRVNAGMEGRVLIDVAEVRTRAASAVRRAATTLGEQAVVYAEVPVSVDPAPLIDAIAKAGIRAKVRAGGVTPDAFPAPAQVARFMTACAARNVAFKATAGLHHPLRGSYPLTYEPDAPTGVMFGFVNVLVAAALARSGAEQHEVERVLDERDARSFTFADDHVGWRHRTISASAISELRAEFVLAVGSCSFREPLDDLHRLAFL